MVAIIIFFIGVLYSGLVTSFLWGWFMVPFGLPEISIAHAIGLSLLVSMLSGLRASTRDLEDSDGVVQGLVLVLIQATLVWILGYIASWFM